MAPGTRAPRRYSMELCNGDISDNISSAIYAFVAANKAGTLLLHAGAELDLSSEGIDDVQASCRGVGGQHDSDHIRFE
jgi:hypothetical protein